MENFRVIVDNAYGVDVVPVSSVSFNYDFSKHQEGLYELTFNFFGSHDNNLTSINNLEVHIEGINMINNFTAKDFNSSGSNLLGYCYPKIINNTGITGMMYADINTNPPVIVRLPCNNNFTVKTLNNLGNYWIDADNNPCDYTMILNFKYIG